MFCFEIIEKKLFIFTYVVVGNKTLFKRSSRKFCFWKLSFKQPKINFGKCGKTVTKWNISLENLHMNLRCNFHHSKIANLSVSATFSNTILWPLTTVFTHYTSTFKQYLSSASIWQPNSSFTLSAIPLDNIRPVPLSINHQNHPNYQNNLQWPDTSNQIPFPHFFMHS